MHNFNQQQLVWSATAIYHSLSHRHLCQREGGPWKLNFYSPKFYTYFLRQELSVIPRLVKVEEWTNKWTNKWTNDERMNEQMIEWVSNHSWCSVYDRHQAIVYNTVFFVLSLYSTRSFELWPRHGCLRYVVGILTSELYFLIIWVSVTWSCLLGCLVIMLHEYKSAVGMWLVCCLCIGNLNTTSWVIVVNETYRITFKLYSNTQ